MIFRLINSFSSDKFFILGFGMPVNTHRGEHQRNQFTMLKVMNSFLSDMARLVPNHHLCIDGRHIIHSVEPKLFKTFLGQT